MTVLPGHALSFSFPLACTNHECLSRSLHLDIDLVTAPRCWTQPAQTHITCAKWAPLPPVASPVSGLSLEDKMADPLRPVESQGSCRVCCELTKRRSLSCGLHKFWTDAICLGQRFLINKPSTWQFLHSVFYISFPPSRSLFARLCFFCT